MQVAAGQVGGAANLSLILGGTFFGAAGGIWQNLYAGRIQQAEDAKEAERARLFNHDLAKAVGKSVATILLPLTKEERLPATERAALLRIAEGAQEAWIRIAESPEASFEPLLEGSLAEAVTIDPVSPALGAYGDEQMWAAVLRRMADDTGADVSSALAPQSKTFQIAAKACHQRFARQFFNDLKHDFATKGQAFAAVNLRMMGELLTLARSQAESNKEVRAKLDTITEAINRRGEEVVAWIGDDPANGAGRLLRLRPITSWLKSIDARLVGIDRKATDIIERLKRLEKQGVRTEQAVREGFAATESGRERAHSGTRRRVGLIVAASTFLLLVAVGTTFLLIDRAGDKRAEQERLADAEREKRQRDEDNAREARQREDADAREKRSRQHTEDVVERKFASLGFDRDSGRSRDELLPSKPGAGATPSGSSPGVITALFSLEDQTAAAAAAAESDDPIVKASAAIIAGETERARKILTDAPESTLRDAAYYTLRGDTYYAEARYDQAADEYAIAIRHLGANPTPRSLNNLANALAQGTASDGPKQAIDIYTRALALSGITPDWAAKILVNRGLTRRDMNEAEGAIADFDAAIALGGAPAEHVARALIHRASTISERGDFDGAIAGFTRAAELEGAPVDARAEAMLGRAELNEDRGLFEDALTDYTRVAEQAGVSKSLVAWALIGSARSLREIGRTAESVADLSRAAELKLPWALPIVDLERGRTYGAQGRVPESIAAYTSAIDSSEASVALRAQALVLRAEAHSDSSDVDGAAADYSRVIDLEGAPVRWLAVALLSRAELRMAAGRGDEAKTDCDRLIALEEAPAELVADAKDLLAAIASTSSAGSADPDDEPVNTGAWFAMVPRKTTVAKNDINSLVGRARELENAMQCTSCTGTGQRVRRVPVRTYSRSPDGQLIRSTEYKDEWYDCDICDKRLFGTAERASQLLRSFAQQCGRTKVTREPEPARIEALYNGVRAAIVRNDRSLPTLDDDAATLFSRAEVPGDTPVWFSASVSDRAVVANSEGGNSTFLLLRGPGGRDIVVIDPLLDRVSTGASVWVFGVCTTIHNVGGSRMVPVVQNALLVPP